MKTCKECHEDKPLSEFYKDGDYLRGDCKACTRRRSARWRDENKERHAANVRNRHLIKTYGITVDEYEAMVAQQGDRCALCGRGWAGGSGSWHVDHDHQTGEVRALLCASCNRKLGVVENREWMEKAMAYLESHGSLVAS